MKPFVVALLAISLLPAQEKPQLKPTELQQVKLENKRKDILLFQSQVAEFTATAEKMQVQANVAESQKQQAIKDLQQLCVTFSKENKWPEGTDCDIQTLAFTTPKVEPKKPVEKK